jgi:hypothetical protein
VLKFMLVVILMAVAVYMTVRLIQRRGIMPPAQGKSSPGRPPGKSSPRPLGPDDDPDFLRDLDRKRRHPEDPEA